MRRDKRWADLALEDATVNAYLHYQAASGNYDCFPLVKALIEQGHRYNQRIQELMKIAPLTLDTSNEGDQR